MSFVLTDVHLPAILKSPAMTDDEFAALCAEHSELMFEMSAEGELIVMAPTFSRSGARNARIIRYLDAWAEQDGQGFAFDSNSGYVLPNGARRSPDASWVLASRVKELLAPGKDSFLHLCPDFAIELRSATDSLKAQRGKMREYIANGTQLGWLINPQERSVSIYRPNAEPETRKNIESITGEGRLATFTLPLVAIWNPFGE